MHRLALILGLIGALVAPAAWSAPTTVGTWTRSCQSGQTINSLKGGGVACYTGNAAFSAEQASPTIDVSSCENIDIFLFDDFDGDSNICTVEWDIEMCPIGVTSTDILRNEACTTLPGITTLSGDDVESNLAGTSLRVHGMGAGANIDSCRILLKCAEDGVDQ